MLTKCSYYTRPIEATIDGRQKIVHKRPYELISRDKFLPISNNVFRNMALGLQFQGTGKETICSG